MFAFGFVIAKLLDLPYNFFLKMYEEKIKNCMRISLLDAIHILNSSFVSLLLTILKPELVSKLVLNPQNKAILRSLWATNSPLIKKVPVLTTLSIFQINFENQYLMTFSSWSWLHVTFKLLYIQLGTILWA